MTPEEYAEIEALTARGLTDIDIAAALGFDPVEVADFIAGPGRSEIISNYRERCIGRAVADPYPDEAAEYLYVRSVPVKMIANTGIVRHRHVYSELARDKKVRYQARQLELARERLRAGRFG